MRLDSGLRCLGMSATVILLSACEGIFGGIYDEVPDEVSPTVSGELYVDASDWKEWHYIDLPSLSEAVAADPGYNTSSAWETYAIDMDESAGADGSGCGIYTYWYDVFGAGISRREYRGHYPTAPQAAPEKWTLAVHRNNVRTNGCGVAATGLASIEELPDDENFYKSLEFKDDEWSESDVWVDQDRMLQGIIGNQGIAVNRVLSSWLTIEIPPMPPAFTLDSRVFVLRLGDGTMAALQLADYQSAAGVKCCLSIKYRYPL